MGILEKLQKILHIDVTIINIKNEPSKDKIKISKKGKEIEITPANLKKKDWDSVEINKGAIDDKEWNDVQKVLKKDFDEHDTTFIEEDAKEKVDDIKQKLELKTTKDVLNYYKGKISDWHLRILEASLYLREKFNEGTCIDLMKRDIVNSFGDEGRNICNLCTAGYFDGFIKELYEEMEKEPGFSIEKFRRKFRKMVRDTPFAVFVHQFKEEESLKGEITSKLEMFQAYGISHLAVHGIGKDNVKKILKVVHEMEYERDDINVGIFKESGVIHAKIGFNT